MVVRLEWDREITSTLSPHNWPKKVRPLRKVLTFFHTTRQIQWDAWHFLGTLNSHVSHACHRYMLLVFSNTNGHRHTNVSHVVETDQDCVKGRSIFFRVNYNNYWCRLLLLLLLFLISFINFVKLLLLNLIIKKYLFIKNKGKIK